MVPFSSILFMAVSCAIGFGVPIGLLLYLHISKKADLLSFFVGCAVMLLFALVLEAAVHRIVLASSAGEVIRGNTWLYGLYGGFMAGLFEETGRLIAFKTVLKKKRDKDINAVMYGAGHGGFEAIVLLGMTMINNMIFAVLINTGNAEVLTGKLTGDALAQVQDAIQQLTALPPYQFLLGGIERLSAIVLHMALSVLVWFAAKQKRKGYLFVIAVFLHFFVDAATVILAGTGVSVIAVEAAVAALSVLSAVYARAVWKKCRAAGPDVLYGESDHE